jgi:hypothetical protein
LRSLPRNLIRKRSILMLLALLVGAVLISIYVPESRAFAIASFLLTIVAIVALRLLWNDSVSFASTAKSAPADPALRDSLAGMTSNVRSATRGSLYSQEEAAKILREAALSKFLGEDYPESWVSGQVGRQAIERILKAHNSEDLIDVLEPSSEKVKRDEYLDKLDRTLRLLEA